MTEIKITGLEKKGWDLDRKIPVALILTMAIQTLTFLVVGTAWVTSTNARLSQIEDFVKGHNNTGVRLSTIETKIDMLMNQAQNGGRK